MVRFDKDSRIRITLTEMGGGKSQRQGNRLSNKAQWGRSGHMNRKEKAIVCSCFNGIGTTNSPGGEIPGVMRKKKAAGNTESGAVKAKCLPRGEGDGENSPTP